MDVVTKSEFAALANVSAARVSQWISGRKIFGDALIGEGRHARIRVDVARDQLKRNLDLDQRLGANGRARLGGAAAGEPNASDGMVAAPEAPGLPAGFPGGPVPDRVEDEIKRARRDQLALMNDRMREDQAARAGRYVDADDARREMGRIAARMVSTFDGALAEFAMAIAARSNLSSRDALHILREAFRLIRASAADVEAKAAAALPALVDQVPDDVARGAQ